ncbi:MAG: hypothetical protein J0H98_08090 [Solirubrobacterales bacterium]|nr:hypothetical protein [Solirubrobacterales bacterium]
MSYARFEDPGSSVYVYLDIGGYLKCCGCPILGDFRAFSTAAMIEHLDRHRDIGDTVPADCYSRLREDADENDAWIAQEGAA